MKLTHFDQRWCENCMKLLESSEQECIPVGCIPTAAVAAFPVTHAPHHKCCPLHHTCPPFTMHVPLCHACPLATHTPTFPHTHPFTTHTPSPHTPLHHICPPAMLAMHAPQANRTPKACTHPPVNRMTCQTGVKTLPCHNFVADGKKAMQSNTTHSVLVLNCLDYNTAVIKKCVYFCRNQSTKKPHFFQKLLCL